MLSLILINIGNLLDGVMNRKLDNPHMFPIGNKVQGDTRKVV